MKLRNLAFAGIAATMLFSCGGEKKTEEVTKEEVKIESPLKVYNIDLANSVVEWKGQMVGGMYYHTGILKFSEASVSDIDGVLTGNFTIDWNSLATTDSNYTEEKPSSYLIGHLKNADFFATDSLGAAKFEFMGTKGNMTIRGITLEESISDVEYSEGDAGFVATAKMTFDRQKYGVSYKNAYSDAIISNDIELVIKLKGAKQVL